MTVALSFVMGTTQSHLVAINCVASPLQQLPMGLGSALIANGPAHLRHHRAASMQVERVHYRRGGEMVWAYFGKAKFGEGKIWYEMLNTMEKCGTNFPNSGIFGNGTGDFHFQSVVLL